jgi:hypothetical protein
VKHSRARSAALLLASFVLTSAAAEPVGLQGDPRAIERIQKMLDQLGGERTWADARTLYLDYRGMRTNPDGPLIERAWRDLQEPNQRIELEGADLNLTWTFTPKSGWVHRKTGVTQIPPERLAGAIADWPFDFYTIIRSFAVADQDFTLEFVEPMRVVVKSRKGESWGWWEIDSDGALVRWGTTFGDGEVVEYVYGPIRDYESVRFPAWGAAVDGSWRFEYHEVRLSPQPIPAELLREPD